MTLCLTNGWANGVWKKALKTLVSSVCGVILAYSPDLASASLTKVQFRHMLMSILCVAIFNEAMYWKNWADNGNGTSNKGTGNGTNTPA